MITTSLTQQPQVSSRVSSPVLDRAKLRSRWWSFRERRWAWTRARCTATGSWSRNKTKTFFFWVLTEPRFFFRTTFFGGFVKTEIIFFRRRSSDREKISYEFWSVFNLDFIMRPGSEIPISGRSAIRKFLWPGFWEALTRNFNFFRDLKKKIVGALTDLENPSLEQN